MSNIADISTGTYDAIVVGGGHNGLVATAYLAKAGLRPLLIEARPTLGGPCGTFEFLPGYRCAFTNSPGSFEPRFIAELQLEHFGLKFIRTDPTVVHPFPRGAFIGWRDRDRLAAQFDAYAPGEAERYFGLLSDLEELGRHLGASMFAPSPDLVRAARDVPRHLAGLFDRVMCGSLRQLLDERLQSEEAKALLGMLALNATLTPPSAPGSAVGLMMRPISLAAYAALDEDDPQPSCRNADAPYHEGQLLLTVDGFIVSDNVTVTASSVHAMDFACSDHQPVTMRFTLEP